MEEGTKQDILRHGFEPAARHIFYAAEGHVCKFIIYIYIYIYTLQKLHRNLGC